MPGPRRDADGEASTDRYGLLSGRFRRPGSRGRGASASPSDEAIAAQLNCHVTAPHYRGRYRGKLRPPAHPYSDEFTWAPERKLLVEKSSRARLALPASHGAKVTFAELKGGDPLGSNVTLEKSNLHKAVLTVRTAVGPKQSPRVRLIVSFLSAPAGLLQNAAASPFGEQLAAVERFWQRELCGIRMPEGGNNRCVLGRLL